MRRIHICGENEGTFYMDTFLEIKKTIKYLFDVTDDVDESNDINVSINYHDKCGADFTVSNEQIRVAYDSYLKFNNQEKLILFNKTHWEVPVLYSSYRQISPARGEIIEDKTNKLSFLISQASPEYIIFILCCLSKSLKENKNYIAFNARRMILQKSGILYGKERINGWEYLSEALGIDTLKIYSSYEKTGSFYRKISSSFEFVCMYRLSVPITEYTELSDLFLTRREPFGVPKISEVASPPQRLFNHEVIDYYTLAIESRDPFTSYISYYHVIEHYFDAVFRKNLTKQIKDRITHPDFSYKDEEQLYSLAKYIRKHMSDDEESGRGNEFESLKYVLKEYIDIDELKNRINDLSSIPVEYYQNNNVLFVSKRSTQIGWSDLSGVFTTLANRIYLTRNALVHSKREMEDNLYKPYEHRQDLIKEIPIIRAVAEQVIINSSEDI